MGVMRLKCVRFGTLPNRQPSMKRPRRATEIPEEPAIGKRSKGCFIANHCLRYAYGSDSIHSMGDAYHCLHGVLHGMHN